MGELSRHRALSLVFFTAIICALASLLTGCRHTRNIVEVRDTVLVRDTVEVRDTIRMRDSLYASSKALDVLQVRDTARVLIRYAGDTVLVTTERVVWRDRVLAAQTTDSRSTSEMASQKTQKTQTERSAREAEKTVQERRKSLGWAICVPIFIGFFVLGVYLYRSDKKLDKL